MNSEVMRGEVWIQDGERGDWLRFCDPVQVVQAWQIDQVLPALREIEQQVEAHGLYAAGYLAYEAAPAFDAALTVIEGESPLPLLWFGLYRAPQRRDLSGDAADFTLGDWTPSDDPATFAAHIAEIHAHIAAGATYQVNYTFRLNSPFAGEPFGLFQTLVAAQQGPGAGPGIGRYAAYLDLGRFAIASASPELFFRRDGSRVVAQPMKGTAARALTAALDRQQADALRRSEKERAENVMIVDMIRNDLGRIARIGSVQVFNLFDVARYPTLHQMTTGVAAETDVGLVELLQALFPCASITGAPKVRTMQIIRALESERRGVYTGAIGYLAPGQRAPGWRAQFNVAIRTAVIDRAAGIATYGVGSGVVWDSVAEREYRECLVKARVLAERQPAFELLESLRWHPGDGYWLLDRHMQRLLASADYFGFAFDAGDVRRRLLAYAAELPGDGARKVRLTVGRNGDLTLTAAPIGPVRPARVQLADVPVDSQTLWLYHKTTVRAVYEQAAAMRSDAMADDVLLWNERGEVTETTTANVVFALNGQLVTPPLSSGLLAGTLRGALLASGRIVERVVTLEQARNCDRWWVINSVRGWRPAVWVLPDNRNPI